MINGKILKFCIKYKTKFTPFVQLNIVATFKETKELY